MLRLASRSSSLAARGARRSSSLSLPGVARRLGEVAKVEMLEAEEPERISAIWDSFHEHRPELAGCSVAAEEHLKIAPIPNFGRKEQGALAYVVGGTRGFWQRFLRHHNPRSAFADRPGNACGLTAFDAFVEEEWRLALA